MQAQFDIDALGIENDKSPITKKPVSSTESFNLTACEYQGIGPRYGQTTIVGHAHAIDGAVTLRSSEGNTARYSQRTHAFGVFATTHRGEPVPFWILASKRSNTTTLDIVSVGITNPTSDIAAELPADPPPALSSSLRDFRHRSIDVRTIDNSTTRVAFAQLQIGGGDVPAPFLLGDVFSGETAINCGKIALNKYGYDYSLNKRTYKTLSLSTIFSSSGALYFGRRFILDSNSVGFISPASEGDYSAHFSPLDSNRQENRLTTPSYTSGEKALIHCAEGVMSQSHAVVGVATGRNALLAVLRDERDANGLAVQYADPHEFRVRDVRTLDVAGSYNQNGSEVATGWAYAPSWLQGSPTSDEVSLVYDGMKHIGLGPANSGLLRHGLIYELAYSLYDVSTGAETNVCTPIRIELPTSSSPVDYRAISIFRQQKVGGVFVQKCGYSMDLPVQKVPIEKVNYYQYRFYYRGLGSQEWLPAGYYWAADLLFNGQNQILWLAKSAIGATIGGSPAQFNDYSPLARDDWFDVAVFQNRFFWVAQKQAIFSLRNNAFAYPLRNTVSLPSGEFRGITVHVFYGQSEQNGRVVFWASDAQYEGRFSGSMAMYPVSVSPSYIAEFPLDGSDFVVQFRSSITAFSSRSAVVAEGTLFFWGESGIYADSGVQPPNKISGPLEPWLGDVYDPTKTKDIHCVYNDRTKEIIWFYKPKVYQGFLTEALVFNAEKNAFYRYGFSTSIDWSQTVNFSQEGSRKRLSCGKRTMLGHSFSLYPQRAVFFDERNNTGDIRHGKEFLVKQITITSNGSRLFLADGYDVSAFADISIGDYFLISQSFEYTELENNYDGRYRISDIGNYYFDIEEKLQEATLSNDKLMPIWLDAYSSIPFKLRTRYITFGEQWQLFMLSYLAVSLRLPKTILQNLTIGIFSNLNKIATTQELILEQNTDGHCIRRLSWPHEDDKTHGLGIGIEMRGDANGASWRLDWLGFDVQAGEDLGRFEQ